MYKIGDVVTVVDIQPVKNWYNAPEETIGLTGAISCIKKDRRGNRWFGVKFSNAPLRDAPPEYDWAYLPHQIGYQLMFDFNPERS